MIDLDKLIQPVKELAKENGAFLLEQRTHFHRELVESKRSHDYVSYVDKESERRIVERLRQLLRGSSFITEEGTAGLSDSEYCWLVDPLDGTTNYIHNAAPYCVSIGLRNKERMLMGVVYECTRDELFWAHVDSKAYLNGKEIHVSDVADPDNAFIEMGFPYDANKYRDFVNSVISKLYGNVGGLRLKGSAAAETCYVACGRFEARFEALIGPWDIGAGSLILQQAGGKTTDFSGGDTFYDGHEVVSTNGLLHEWLLQIIQDCLKNKK